MITGAHSIIYSSNPEADRAFFRDVLKFPYVDIGHDWLIFALPPSEFAVHPAEKSGLHELYFMCDDLRAFIENMKLHRISCGPIRDERWGSLTEISLPGSGKIGVYQPKHARP